MREVLLTLMALTLTATAWGKTQSGTLTMDFDLSAQPAGQEVRLWIPYPVSDAYQDISAVRTEGDFAEAAVYTDRVNSTPMLSVRWPATAKSRKLSFSFHVEREDVLRRDLPGREAPWNPADFSAYLGPTSLGPIDGGVKQLANEITAGKTGALQKTKAIYDWICENMFRDPKTRGCGLGDVNTLLKSRGGKCADISSVFVALCRAAGIPAREVFGIRQGKEGLTDVTTWYHCWAEFYLPGYGWVPADPGDVRKMMLTQNLTLEDAKTKEYRAYFWGGVDPYRVKLSNGRDLTLNPAQAGPPVNYLMYPYAEVGGQAVDWLDPEHFVYHVTWQP